jgi:hypothetical protein
VKLAVERGLLAIGDTEHLSQTSYIPGNLPMPGVALALAQLEARAKRLELRRSQNEARLTDRAIANDYQGQKGRAAKQGVIDRYAAQRNVQALIVIARIETDPGLKRKVVEHLIDLNTPDTREYLLEILK